MMKNALVLRCSGIALISAALILGGCKGKKQEAPQRPPVSVSVAMAQEADVPVYLDAFGRLRALNDVDIKPQVSGKLVSAPFTEGTKVEKGAVLFEIERDVYEAAVDQAQGEVDAAQAALRQSRETLKRNEQLLEQNLISQEDYDQLKTAVDSAKAGREQGRAALLQAQINLNYCTVTSPVSGITGRRLVDPGNFVSAGGQTLVNVRTIDPLYVDFAVSEVYLPDLKKAMAKGDLAVLVMLAENAGEPGLFHGTVKMVDNAVNAQSGTIALRALVNNPDGKLWPGQFVNVYPVLDELEDAVLVPQSAVALGKDGPYGFAIKDGQADVRMVEKGPNVGEAVVIKKGFRKGDVVVTQGQLGLWPGAPVSVKETLDAEQQQDVKKKLKDPNVIATIQMMAAVGTPTEEIAVFVGIPASALEEEAKKITPRQDANADMVGKMKEGGMTDEEIAQATGKTAEEVQQLQQKAGAPDENSEQQADKQDEQKQEQE